MMKDQAKSEVPTQNAIPTPPVLTCAEAHVDRTMRARKHASACILLAVVTSPEISADLIDRAIIHARDADSNAT